MRHLLHVAPALLHFWRCQSGQRFHGRPGTPLKHLALAAVNCSRQNKNKTMIKFCAWLVESRWVKKVILLFLIKGHTKQDADKKLNLLKQGANGEEIWTGEELDSALTKKNEQYINLMRVEGQKWTNWTEGLNDYYRDPPSGWILVNHEFMFGDSDMPTKYKRKNIATRTPQRSSTSYLCTRRSGKMCVPLTANERAEDLVNLPCCLGILPAPGLSAKKTYECKTKLRRLAPEHAKDYYNRIQFEHKAMMEKKW